MRGEVNGAGKREGGACSLEQSPDVTCHHGTSTKEKAPDTQDGSTNRNRALGAQMIQCRSCDQAHYRVRVVVGPQNRTDAQCRSVKRVFQLRDHYGWAGPHRILEKIENDREAPGHDKCPRLSRALHLRCETANRWRGLPFSSGACGI